MITDGNERFHCISANTKHNWIQQNIFTTPIVHCLQTIFTGFKQCIRVGTRSEKKIVRWQGKSKRKRVRKREEDRKRRPIHTNTNAFDKYIAPCATKPFVNSAPSHVGFFDIFVFQFCISKFKMHTQWIWMNEWFSFYRLNTKRLSEYNRRVYTSLGWAIFQLWTEFICDIKRINNGTLYDNSMYFKLQFFLLFIKSHWIVWKQRNQHYDCMHFW